MKSVKNIYVLFLVLLCGYGLHIVEGAAAQAGGGAVAIEAVENNASLQQKNNINSAFQTQIGTDGLTEAQREFIDFQRSNTKLSEEERNQHASAWATKFKQHNNIGHVIKIHRHKKGYQVALDHDVAQELTEKGLFDGDNQFIVSKGLVKVIHPTKGFVKKSSDSAEDYTNKVSMHPVYNAKNITSDFYEKIDLLNEKLKNITLKISNILHKAVQENHIETVRDMLAGGIDPNIINFSTYETPIFNAKTPEMVDILISNKANVNHLKEHDVSPLMQALAEGNIEKAEKLIDAGADVKHNANAYINFHMYPTALHVAVHKGFGNMVNKLLNAGANPSIKNKFGQTAFHIASPEMLKIMIGDGECPVCLQALSEFDPQDLVSLDCCGNKQMMCKNCFDQTPIACPLCRDDKEFKSSKTLK